MSYLTNQIILRNRPQGRLMPANFKLREYILPELKPNQVLLRAIYISLDPYMRGRMNAIKTYAKTFEINEPLKARGIGQIVQSKNSNFAAGELVLGTVDWANYSITDGAKIRPLPTDTFPITHYLGVLGMPAMTAWVGMKLAAPKPMETVFVSAASGAVGQVVGQLAKIAGCRIIGSAGNDDKINFLINELGFDAAFNYKSGVSVTDALKPAAPDGIDIYFDNVGGIMLEAALDHANNFARFIQCGMISQYNLSRGEMSGIRNLTHINRKRIRMEGFIVSDYDDQLDEFMTDMQNLLKAGKITYRIDVVQGLENTVTTFISMLNGGNFGKQIVQLGPEE